MAAPKNRTQLQNLFKSGAKPSEADFKNFIDGVLNISDDGIEKPAGDNKPLKLSTHGEEENALDIYAGEVHTWRVNQKPTGGSPGFNLETQAGDSRLFVESSTGNLGLGITKPIAKVHIQQSGSQDALRIDDEAGDTTPLVVNADGNVGIGTGAATDKALSVKGDTAIAGTLSVTQTSTLTGNVGIGGAPTKTEALKVTGNTAIIGNLSIKGQLSVDNIQQEAWKSVTFANSWTNHSNGYNQAGYFKDSMGIVHLRGLIKSGAIGEAAFTLPEGYRPQHRELHVAATEPEKSSIVTNPLSQITKRIAVTATFGRIDIDTNGNVLIWDGNNLWISLDGITFRAK